MAWNRCGLPTPPDGGPTDQDHRKCPICGWLPCLPNCRLALNYWDVEMGLARLEEGDRCNHGLDDGRDDFTVGEEPFLPPQDYEQEEEFRDGLTG